MGKTVLYLAAALVMGFLTVGLSIAITFAAYATMAAPGEYSTEAAMHALYTGGIVYLCMVWTMQEALTDKMSVGFRTLIFLVSPAGIVLFYAQWNPLLSLTGLILIAALAAYQTLVVRSKRHQGEVA